MRLIAEFSIDPDDGKPASAEGSGVSHYSIALKLLDAPPSTQRVRYHLHASYFDPVRSVSARMPDFEEPMTSYGDFEITAEVQDGSEKRLVKRLLSDALEEGHRDALTGPIQQAIEDIKSR